MKKKLGVNLGFQTFYQILITILPLITAPYLSRILGVESLGVFSYTNSVASYFTLFAFLGTLSYGTRTIASNQSDKKIRSVTFWEIYLLQAFSSAVCIAAYYIYIMLFCNDNQLILMIQGIALIGTLTDISWLYFGMEDFRLTVTANGIVKVISVTCILLFVKEKQDLWLYTLIMVSSIVISNMLLWIPIHKVVDLWKIKNIKIKTITKHIKPNIVLFIPLLAMSVYHVMDKTMLGSISTFEQSGFYYNSDRVVSTPVGIINGFCTVMLSRITVFRNESEVSKANEYFFLSIKGMGMITSAMAFGLAAIANEFIPIFYGPGYDTCILLMIFLSPILIIKGYCYIARMLYLVPAKKENVYIGSVIAGAITNLIANSILIPKYGAFGAVIGTLISEFVSCVWQYLFMMKYINYVRHLLSSLVYMVFGIVMYVTVRFSVRFLSNGLLGLFEEILIGAIIYLTLCIVYWLITKNTFIRKLIKR